MFRLFFWLFYTPLNFLSVFVKSNTSRWSKLGIYHSFSKLTTKLTENILLFGCIFGREATKLNPYNELASWIITKRVSNESSLSRLHDFFSKVYQKKYDQRNLFIYLLIFYVKFKFLSKFSERKTLL